MDVKQHVYLLIARPQVLTLGGTGGGGGWGGILEGFVQNGNCRQALFVSRFGLVVRRQAGKQRDLGSNLLRLSFVFKSCGLWTLSCDLGPLTIIKH